MAERRGMGRGLAAILSVSQVPDGAAEELRALPVDLIEPNPRQPRTQFDEDALGGLAESLKVHGVLQPVLVRPLAGGRYELIAGERRWRAAKLAGIAEIPALVRDRDDAESLEVALIENMARADLSPVEEARACAALVEELGLTREQVGLRVGRSRVAVANLIRLLDLPDDVLALLDSGALTEGHGRALLLATEHADRRRLAQAAVDAGWSVRELEERARAADRPPAERTAPSPATSHPDLEDELVRVAERLEAVLGGSARVKPRRSGYRVEVDVSSLDDLLALAARLTVRAAA